PADLTEPRDGESRQDRYQQHLKQIAARQRPEETVRDDTHQMRDNAFFFGAADVACHRLWIERRRVDVEALARLQQLADDQADRQRQGRNRLEVEQRLDADAADLLEIAHRADAIHHGAEDHRRDHHLDQGDEAIAERFQLNAGLRKQMADQDADRDGNQDLNIENAVPRARAGHGSHRYMSEPSPRYNVQELFRQE